MSKPKPILRLRAGLIQVTVFESERERNGNIVINKFCCIEKNYKDKETDEWKKTNFLERDEIPKASMLLNEAYKEITLKSETISN